MILHPPMSGFSSFEGLDIKRYWDVKPMTHIQVNAFTCDMFTAEYYEQISEIMTVLAMCDHTCSHNDGRFLQWFTRNVTIMCELPCESSCNSKIYVENHGITR